MFSRAEKSKESYQDQLCASNAAIMPGQIIDFETLGDEQDREWVCDHLVRTVTEQFV
jgi:hypothetical protein